MDYEQIEQESALWPCLDDDSMSDETEEIEPENGDSPSPILEK